MRAREEKKTRKKVMMNCGLGWIRGLSGQEQDMSSLTFGMGTILLVICMYVCMYVCMNVYK